MSFKNRFNIEYNMAAVVSHTIQALLATKPASVTWIGFGETPAAGANTDGWTKVGGGGSQRPKVRYSLETLRAMSKKPECVEIPPNLANFGVLKGGSRQQAHMQNTRKQKKVITLSKNREPVVLGNRAENRWGGTGRMPGSQKVDPMTKVMNDINGVLNKLSPPKNQNEQDKCQRLLEQLCVKLNGVEGAGSADIYPKLIAIIMDKAANQEFFGQMYALVCKICLEHLGKDSGFADELKKQVDEAFPKYTKGSREQIAEAKAEREAEHKAAGKEGEAKFSQIDQGDVEAKALAQHKGFMTFLGELHREQFNNVAYVEKCATTLLDSAVPDPDHERLTCAMKMLEAVGSYAKKPQMDKWVDAVLATKESRPMRFKLNIELLVALRDKKWRRPKNDEKHAIKMKIAPINYEKLRTEKAIETPAPAAAAAPGPRPGAGGPAGGVPGRAGSGAGGPGPAGGAPARAGSGGTDSRPPRMPPSTAAAELAKPGLQAVPPSPVMARASPDRGGMRGGPPPPGGAATSPGAGTGAGGPPKPSPPHPLQQGHGQGPPGPRSGSGPPPRILPAGGAPASGHQPQAPGERKRIVLSRPGAGGPAGGAPFRAPMSRGGADSSAGPTPGAAAPAAEPMSDRQIKNVVDDYLDGAAPLDETIDLLKSQTTAAQDKVVKMVVEKWITGDKSKPKEQEACGALIEPMLARKQASAAHFTSLLKERAEYICDDALDYPPASACMVEVISIGIRTNTIVLPIFTKDGTEFYSKPFAEGLFEKLKWLNPELRKALGIEWLVKKAEEVLPPLPTRD